MSRINRMESIRKFLLQDPDDTFLNFALALEFVAIGDDNEAAEIMKKINLREPEYIPVYYHLGKLMVRINNFELAKELFEKGITYSRTQKDLKNLSELQSALNEIIELED